jgi:hypothetical protein
MLFEEVPGVIATDRDAHWLECTQQLSHAGCTLRVMGAGTTADLPRVTPSLLRRADEMCRRRLAHEYESGRKLSGLGDAPFEVSNRLAADAITWHRGAVAREHGFPDPTDLEPEQRAVYRAAARAYLRMFGDTSVEVHDLGWSSELPDLGVRLVGSVGIPIVDSEGACALRVLRVGARLPLIDSVDIRFLILRASTWAHGSLRIIAVDLLEDRSVEYGIDLASQLDEARSWLATRVDVISGRAHPRHTNAGADCRDCPCLPGCPQLTRP